MTVPKITRPAKPIINEGDIQYAKGAAKHARHMYMTCRRPGRVAAWLEALFRWRESLLLACGGANDRFAVEWRDVMEGM